jgi:hypothetical protein
MPENGLNKKIIKDCHISILALVFIEINPKTVAKKLIFFGFLLFFLGKIGFSQQTIAATEIMKDLRAGKDISISNATIVGNLDFTLMEEQIEKLPSKRIPPKRNNTIKCKVLSKVSFTNCIFKNHVLAYIPDGDNTGYTFIADFEDDAIFQDCTFKRKALFKHSVFKKTASFAGSRFYEDTSFKHAIFESHGDFMSVKFESDMTFKHAIFKKLGRFDNAIFKDNISFKHSMFLMDCL